MKIGPQGFRGVRQLSQPNRGMAPIAQTRLDHTISRANAQLEEALTVDGFPIQHWKKTERGNFCTCQDIDYEQAAHAIRFVDYEKFNEQVEQREATKRGFVAVFREGAIRDRSSNVDTDFVGRSRVDDVVIDEDLIDDNLSQQSELVTHTNSTSYILSGDTHPCGICLGSGYVEGYSLLNGFRYVFDASSSYKTKVLGYIISSEDKPFSFSSVFDADNFVSWEFAVPAYYKYVLSLSVFNNLEPVDSRLYRVQLMNVAGQFQDFSDELLDSLRGRETEIRITTKGRYDDIALKFTHINLVFQYADFFKAQMPLINQGLNYGRNEAIVSSTMVMSPRVSSITREDLIYEGKQNWLWVVTDVTDAQTSKNQVFGYQVSVRRILSDDMREALRLIYEPKVQSAYSGFERLQGNFAANNI